MRLTDFLRSGLLLEGGNAIKGSSPITQSEVKEISEELLSKISKALNLAPSKVKLIGSAGKKPNSSDTSGDIDVAVECTPEEASKAAQSLGSGKSKAMRGINVYSFAYDIGEKFIQVDLMPVNNIKFAEWSYQANEADLAEGLKGSHRNELFFAVAKHMPREVLERNEGGEEIEIKRFYYDLSRGLMTGIMTRKTKTGRISKNFTSRDKKVISDDPVHIAKEMFGTTPNKLETFEGTLEAIKSPKFPYSDKLKKILVTAREGISNKNLSVPQSIK